MRGYHLDPHPMANVADRHYAVIYSPRRKRDRFPATNVQVFSSKELALEHQDVSRNQYAAQVMGPAKSSEGFKIYYLISWLGE